MISTPRQLGQTPLPGRYDTESALQHVLAVEASVEMALPLVFADTTTRNRAYSMFWLSKRPQEGAGYVGVRLLEAEAVNYCGLHVVPVGNDPAAVLLYHYHGVLVLLSKCLIDYPCGCLALFVGEDSPD